MSCSTHDACEKTLHMKTSWDDGTDFARKWRCRDVLMLHAMLEWELSRTMSTKLNLMGRMCGGAGCVKPLDPPADGKSASLAS
eukprot:5204126-Prymnesium_polylepis.1